MLALPIGALRPSSTPRVPQTRRNTATLDAVGDSKDVYWNNLELVDALSTKTFAKMPAFVSEKTIKECSKGAMEAFENQGGHDGMYLNKPWKNSRIYYDARRVWTPEDASFWEPLVREVRQNIAQAFGLGSDLEKALPLEAAFVNYYVGLPGQPRDMERHVDCCVEIKMLRRVRRSSASSTISGPSHPPKHAARGVDVRRRHRRCRFSPANAVVARRRRDRAKYRDPIT